MYRYWHFMCVCVCVCIFSDSDSCYGKHENLFLKKAKPELIRLKLFENIENSQHRFHFNFSCFLFFIFAFCVCITMKMFYMFAFRFILTKWAFWLVKPFIFVSILKRLGFLELGLLVKCLPSFAFILNTIK